MSNTHDTGGPAFPAMGNDMSGHGMIGHVPGMTLLDFFAAHALAGELASQSGQTGEWQGGDLKLAKLCYDHAEAMIYEKRRREGATC